jgi:hypothetical protein
VQATPPKLRPLSVGEVLDVAIKIYFRNARTLFAIVVVVVAPLQLLSAFVTTSAESQGPAFIVNETTGEVTIEWDRLWLYVTASAVIVVFSFIAATFAIGACFKAVSDAYLGARPTPRQSLAFALRKVHSIMWITVLGAFLAFLGVLLCIVPGIWLYVAFAVAVPALLMEDVRGRRALGRSRRLVKGRWWPTFGILILGGLLAGIVSAAISAALEVLVLADPGSEVVAVVLRTIGGTVAGTLATPFQAAFVTVLYFDLRVRREGFDLQLLAERIGLTRPPEGGFRPAPTSLPPPPPAPAAAGEGDGEQPPYWPPPPGWKPSSER